MLDSFAMLLHAQQPGIGMPPCGCCRAFHSALPPETAASRPSIHLRGGWILEGLIDRVEDDDCGAIVGGGGH